VANLIITGDLGQRTGIFKFKFDDRSLEKFKKRFTHRHHIGNKVGNYYLPFVIREQRYYRAGAEVRLHLSYVGIKKLCRCGLLRPADGKEFSSHVGIRGYIDILSIAQTLSWLWDIPIEDILISETVFRSSDFLSLDPEDRVKILFNAYRGCDWLENFILRQQSRQKILSQKRINPLHKISRAEICDWFVIDTQGTFFKNLVMRGFVIPDGARFTPKSKLNFISLPAFLRFISLLTSVPVVEFYDSKSASYYELLAERFAVCLTQYLAKVRISPIKTYSLSESSRLTRTPLSTLYSATKLGILRSKKANRVILIQGIDLVIYLRKHKYGGNRSFNSSDVINLFGIGRLDLKQLGMRVSDKGTYSRVHFVYPAYDLLAGMARKKILGDLNDPSIPIVIGENGLIVYLTKKGRDSYCEAYGLEIFDEDCLEDLRQELREVELGKSEILDDKPISTQNLEIHIKWGKINSCSLRDTP
jgi:hypothetical protein